MKPSDANDGARELMTALVESTAVDSYARDRIARHEAECAERWQQLRALTRWVIGLIVGGQGVVIALLAGALLK